MANQSTVTSSVKKAKKVYGGGDKDYNSAIDTYASAIEGSYNRQREASDRTFAENYARASNEALSRGMGRSSYALQTLSNIDTEKARANSEIWDKQSEDVLKYAAQLQQFMKEYQLKQEELNLQKQQLAAQRGGGGGGGGRYGGGNNSSAGTGNLDDALNGSSSLLGKLGYTQNNGRPTNYQNSNQYKRTTRTTRNQLLGR